MFYTIYKITNKINGKYYIGKHQTTNLNDGYMGSGKNVKRAIAKYGIENFTKEILHTYDNEADMNAAEKKLVVISEETYNLCEGGKGGFSHINKNNLSVKNLKNPNVRKVATKNSNKKRIENFNNNTVLKKQWEDNISNSLKSYYKTHSGTFTGKRHPKEIENRITEKLKITNKGSGNPNFGKCWIKNVKTKEYGMILKSDLNYWISLGWELGQIRENGIPVKLKNNQDGKAQ